MDDKELENKINQNVRVPPIEISSPIDLLHKLALSEEEYRLSEFNYNDEYNRLLLVTDWDKVNEKRLEKGLSKLSNQDMKKAYIEEQLKIIKREVIIDKLQYNRLLRMYELMKKYSLDVLR